MTEPNLKRLLLELVAETYRQHKVVVTASAATAAVGLALLALRLLEAAQ